MDFMKDLTEFFFTDVRLSLHVKYYAHSHLLTKLNLYISL